MMNVYIGKIESRIVVTDSRALVNPPPEKLAPTSMKNPPKSQTPASNGRPTCFPAAALSVHFARKKVVKNDAYIPAIEVITLQDVDEYIRQPEANRASDISLTIRNHCIDDHFIGAILS
jgi:hypothetical protein